ncbi:hypothetical protein MMB17_05155 [Methylobacterium organophilum]|uniref:hypothetical protein n=1 Tax=Methylobacterium organophilum TaxID=410 RepID=UPI001F13E0A7|nr:hypothetical protein [Methylobacterium organophilum]UMY18714.1 hypothetical protein MMB17_05155 [Methylobacterium organophilum]
MTPSIKPRRKAPVPARPTTNVVPFPAAAIRRFRRDEAEGPRGAILLFTGVRYERLADDDAAQRLRKWS